ncbi:MAG: CotH kinase family protein [Bacteroidota bacterium]
MKKIITLVFFFFSFCIQAQLFTGAGGIIPDNGQYNYFNIPVTGLSPTQLDNSFGIEEVCIDITHPALSELHIYLQSPAGTLVELNWASSASGANYVSTCFNSKASTSITTANAPYTGNYKPVGYLGRFNTGQNSNGTWKLVVHDYNVAANTGSVITWSIMFSNTPPPAVSFTSSNLPIITINTNNQTISETEVMVDMGIIDNGTGQRNNLTDPKNNYNGKTMIHIRGSSSKVFAKKPYSIETRDASGSILDASLLGMPEESDWTLIPAYPDKTLIRNPITYELFRQMGNYAPRFRHVELILNNEYRGVYALIEKPKRNKERIDISKLTMFDNLNPDVTGGYIIKIDRTNEDGWYSLLAGNSQTNAKFYYQYVYPKDTAITSQQKTYIKDYMDNFETVMNSPSFAHPTNGYPGYIDVTSFIDYFIITELCKNVDGYKLSTYLYKDNISKGGKLHIGPVWDYDLSWHNCNYGNAFSTAGWQYQIPGDVHPSPTWWSKFLQDPVFVNKLNCRWNELRQGILSTNSLNSYIDQSAAKLEESQQRNFTQWPILGAYISPNPQNQTGATYQTELTDLKNWISGRTTWLDGNMPGICTNIGITEGISQDLIQIFPNPFMNNISIAYTLSENSSVQLELIDVIGKQALLIFNGNKPAGNYQEELTTHELATGVYFIKVNVNGKISHQKLVKVAEK